MIEEGNNGMKRSREWEDQEEREREWRSLVISSFTFLE